MNDVLDFLKSIKAPYVFIMVIMVVATALYMLAYSGLEIEGAAFKFAITLVAGYGAQALIAVRVEAVKTCLLMVAATLILLIGAITFTDASVFKDMAIDGAMVSAAGAIIAVTGELLNRLKQDG